MIDFKRIFRIFILVAFLGGLLGPAGLPAAVPTAKAHPLLVETALATPDRLVRVIAQKSHTGDTAEELARTLGAEITKDLHIINAFAAEMTAEAAVRLASSREIRWISLDAPVERSSIETYTLRDEFSLKVYNNNNGTQSWAGNWIEINDDNNPANGRVKIDQNQLRLEEKIKGIQRSGNLSGAFSATLTFNYRRDRMDKSSKYVSVDVSSNGGITWQQLGVIAGPANDTTARQASYDVTAYVSDVFVVRLMTSSGMGGKLWVDNLQIEYSIDTMPPPDDPPVVELPPLPPADFPFTQNVQDDMYAPAILDFRFNSGSRNWTSPWMEIGEEDGSKAGDIRHSIFDYWDRIQLYEYGSSAASWTPVKGVWRSTDLSTATTAVLSFVYRRFSMEGDDYVTLEISPDEGATWFEIDRFGAGTELQFQTANYNISPFISPDVVIRFVTSYGYDDFFDNFAFDDVNIAFDPQPLPALPQTFLDTLGVRSLWDSGLKGSYVYVAVIDSGMAPDWDFQRLPGEPGGTSSRLHTQVSFNDDTNLAFDTNGHGTHVAGIIGGSGQKSNGTYMGIAPNVGFISLKVADDNGVSSESDVVEALQWIYDNNAAGGQPYLIRVVNLSLNSTVEQSYHTSPINAAVEILWFNGVVVVASAGNAGSGMNPINSAPANDPFIITVGASDEHYTADRGDDTVATFSAYGTTLDGIVKPDLIAPGKDIIATLAETSWWRNNYNDRFIDGIYFRISGTSMAAPMVTGAVALLLQDEPNLTPDQVKYRLMNTGSTIQGVTGDLNSYAYLDVYGAVTGLTSESANTGQTASHLLWTGVDPVTWGSVSWNSVSWNSVSWNSVSWNSVSWNSVSWNSVFFDEP